MKTSSSPSSPPPPSARGSRRRTAARAALGVIAAVALVRIGCGVVAARAADSLDAMSAARARDDIAAMTSSPRPRVGLTSGRECGAEYAAFDHRKIAPTPGTKSDIAKEGYAHGLPIERIDEARTAVRLNRALLDDLRTATRCDHFDAPHADPRDTNFLFALQAFRLGKALVLDADVRALEGDAQRATDEYVDVMRFGSDLGPTTLSHGRVAVSLLQTAVERVSSRALAPGAEVDLRALDAQLAALAPALPSFARAMHREHTAYLSYGAAAIRQRGIGDSLREDPYDPLLIEPGSGWAPPPGRALSLLLPIDLYVALQARAGDRNFQGYEDALAVPSGPLREPAIDAAIERSAKSIGTAIEGWSTIVNEEERLRESFAVLRARVASALVAHDAR